MRSGDSFVGTTSDSLNHQDSLTVGVPFFLPQTFHLLESLQNMLHNFLAFQLKVHEDSATVGLILVDILSFSLFSFDQMQKG